MVSRRALWGYNQTLKALDMSDCYLIDADLDSLIQVLIDEVNLGGSAEGTPNALENLSCHVIK